ncbi:MAG: glycosyl hydrolase, partial [Acidobacteria bacterium]|nr:glycosyl hydrolase [Candidatus Sulfomarinibacter sp. MAG AM2]
MRKILLVLVVFALALPTVAADEEDTDTGTTAKPFAGLTFRSIGPALMSGRIADIAIHPTDPSTWYVAVGSGGVWKTANSGTTWKPIFDEQNSYSIGCVVLDQSNPEIVWVGTGENVGGRHVGFGDGIYKSSDGGSSWKNMGLEESQHISEIIVDPTDSNTVYAAAQGPLWSPGGERGLFKTTDGGRTWDNILSDGEWTGVTDVVMDPRDPKVLYAATWQRHRTVAALIDGGPESGIHKTTDGGAGWSKLTNGLPEGNVGKIGLTMSPQNPDVVYAVIELDNREGGTWRTADRGASWEKRSDAVTGGTGPHYYQEIEASPHAFDRIYLIDVRMQVSDDGGATFRRVKNESKHVDNHALAFRPDDPDWLLAGTDGGLYESFDLAESWRFVANLPVTQFYKLAVDDSEPFYNVYGGTQDNNTQGGPTRTDNINGISNADWFITLFADGHQPAVEPGNPDIVYSEWQQGNLMRTDRTTGGIVYIQPQPEPGDPPERFNWDAPILISPHSPTRLYFASQRVWRSDNRGDSWTPISPDLTKNQDRILLPVMGRQWSSTAPWDLFAMSNYNTITSLAESPAQEGLLWAGTDDGLLQISADGGASWTSTPVGDLPGVPATAFVNDIKADLYDAGTVYVCLDNHKYGDFKPYLMKTTDRGRSWRSITGDLPDRHLVWRLVQDHVKPELLFAATEFGIFFTVDGGAKWVKLSGGVPTISFRDLVIQRRENDLIGASFGRGFYVLDDYTPLREIDEKALAREAALFPVRTAPWYIQRRPLGQSGQASLGGAFYIADNPPFGAVFTYHLGQGYESLEDQRREAETKLEKEWKNTPYAGYDALERERRQPKATILLTVR